MERRFIVSLAFSVAILAIVIGSVLLPPFFERTSGTANSVQKPASKNPFEAISLNAKAAIVWDTVRKKPIYAQNAEAQLPLASLAKIMTAHLASEYIGDDQFVVVDREAVSVEGDNGLLVGERWITRDLLGLTLVASSNDGARAIANAVLSASGITEPFADIMNRESRKIGLSQAFFLNESGLDVHDGISGAYGSARDVALLLDHILRSSSDILEPTRYEDSLFTSADGFTHKVSNTNERVEAIPGIIASKTGFTNLAGGNLAVAFEAGPGYPFVAVVLGSTEESRVSDIETLVWATLAFIESFY